MHIEEQKSIRKGDSCNTFIFRMRNHCGTHIDAPAHFFKDAKAIADYPAEYLIFRHPRVINIALSRDMLIDLEDVKDKIGKADDLVMLKTGFGRLRGKKEYSFRNPSVSPQIGLWLRARRKNVRAIGFDFISLSSCRDRDLGRQAHRAFLDPKGKGRPVLIIEDMDLSGNLGGLKAVWLAPLLLKGLDSAPCAALGLF